MLQEQVACLREERSDWLTQRRGLQVELESEKEEKMREREEQAAKVQKLTEHLQKQSKVSIIAPPLVQHTDVTLSCRFLPVLPVLPV